MVKDAAPTRISLASGLTGRKAQAPISKSDTELQGPEAPWNPRYAIRAFKSLNFLWLLTFVSAKVHAISADMCCVVTMCFANDMYVVRRIWDPSEGESTTPYITKNFQEQLLREAHAKIKFVRRSTSARTVCLSHIVKSTCACREYKLSSEYFAAFISCYFCTSVRV